MCQRAPAIPDKHIEPARLGVPARHRHPALCLAPRQAFRERQLKIALAYTKTLSVTNLERPRNVLGCLADQVAFVHPE